MWKEKKNKKNGGLNRKCFKDQVKKTTLCEPTWIVTLYVYQYKKNNTINNNLLKINNFKF